MFTLATAFVPLRTLRIPAALCSSSQAPKKDKLPVPLPPNPRLDWAISAKMWNVNVHAVDYQNFFTVNFDY